MKVDISKTIAINNVAVPDLETVTATIRRDSDSKYLDTSEGAWVSSPVANTMYDFDSIGLYQVNNGSVGDYFDEVEDVISIRYQAEIVIGEDTINIDETHRQVVLPTIATANSLQEVKDTLGEMAGTLTQVDSNVSVIGGVLEEGVELSESQPNYAPAKKSDVSDVMNTAIPANPTQFSIYERIKAIDARSPGKR